MSIDPSSSGRPGRTASFAAALMPGVFVVLWSTGFIGAKLGLPHAEPLTFLALRFAIVLAILVPLALALGSPWPRRPRQVAHLAVVGLLVHALYLGGVFVAIGLGMSAGISALIVGLQPLLTAIAAGPLLGERVTARAWVGLALGFVGVAVVLSGRSAGGSLFQGIGLAPVASAAVAVAAITAGTLYQKRFGGGMDLVTGTTVQYAAGGIATAAGALAFESLHVDWTAEFVFALLWLVLVLSIGAIFLLMLLIRRGEANRTAGLFYLVPPVTAVMAWALFGERLGWVALLGMAVAVAGVALVVRR